MEAKTLAKDILAVGSIIGGHHLLKKANKDGQLSGKAEFWHGTEKKRVPQIMKEGLKRSHASERGTIIKRIHGENYIPEDDNIYLARKKELAQEVNRARYVYKNKSEGKQQKALDKYDNKGANKSQQVLHIEIPRGDWLKMKKVSNPEVLGAKNAKEFRERYLQRYPDCDMPLRDFKEMYNDLEHNTATVSGNIDPKFIRNSNAFKDYKDLDYFKKHLRSNPGDFLKGAGTMGIGAAGIALGGLHLIRRGLKK